MASPYKSPEETVKYYSDELTNLISSVNKIIYVVFFFVIFCWIYIIEGLNIRYVKYINDHRRQIAQLQQEEKEQHKKLHSISYLKIKNEGINQPDSKIKDASKLKEPDTSRLLKERRKYDKVYVSNLTELIENEKDNKNINDLFEKNIDTLEKKISKLKEEIKNSGEALSQKDFNEFIKDIPFPFKTIFYFTNSLKNGPQALIVIITILVIYIYSSRIKVLRYTARIIRITKNDQSLGVNPYYDLNISNPFWIAPFPANGTKYISDNDYAILTGNKENRKLYKFFTLSAIILLIVIELRMLSLQINYSKTPMNILFFANLLMFLISTAIATDWFCSWTIPDHFNNEKKPTDYDRRRYIIVAGGIAILTIGYRLRKFIPEHVKPNIYPKKKKKAIIESRLYNKWIFNKRSMKFHYFDKHGNNPLINLKKGKDETEQFLNNSYVIDRSKINLPSTNKVKHAWVIEHLALNFIAQQKPDDAFKLLSGKIGSHTMNFRFWDLWAKIYFIHLKDSADHTKVFKTICEDYQDVSDEIVRKKIKKFKSKTWQEKIASKKNVKFNHQNI